MITKNNISETLNSLGESEVNKAFLDSKDFILLQVFVTNSGFTASIESCDYSEEIEQEAADNGNLFIDKDSFLTLFKDSDSINPFLIALL